MYKSGLTRSEVRMNRLGIKGILALVMAAMLLIGSAQAISLVDAIGQLMQPEQPAVS